MRNKWFTLVELIVVIAIIAILAVIAGLTVTQWVWESRDSRVQSDVGTLARWLEVYLAQPDVIGGLTGVDGEGDYFDEEVEWKDGDYTSWTIYDLNEDFVDEQEEWQLNDIISDIPNPPHDEDAYYKVALYDDDPNKFSVAGQLEEWTDTGDSEPFVISNHSDENPWDQWDRDPVYDPYAD